MNGYSFAVEKDKFLYCAIKPDSKHHDFWIKAIKVLSDIEFKATGISHDDCGLLRKVLKQCMHSIDLLFSSICECCEKESMLYVLQMSKIHPSPFQ